MFGQKIIVGRPLGICLLIAACTLIVTVSSVVAKQMIPLSAAIAQCEAQSIRYGRTLHGQGADTPPDHLVDQRFRSCVHAKSGQYPPKPSRKSGLKISGSAAIGLVFKN